MFKQGPTIEVRACNTIRLLNDRPTLTLEPGDAVKVCVQPRAIALHVCDPPAPPPLVYYTSQPYRPVNIENLQPQATISRINLRTALNRVSDLEEAIEPQATITRINLRNPRIYLEIAPENLQPQATITRINLRDPLVRLDGGAVGFESLQPQATITRIELRAALVKTAPEPEALQPQATITRIRLA